jgi:hypothetical protein
MSEVKRLVLVEWMDACCNSGWQDDGTVIAPVKCFTAGWLWHEDELSVMIVGTMQDDCGAFNQTMVIPKGMVLTTKDL